MLKSLSYYLILLTLCLSLMGCSEKRLEDPKIGIQIYSLRDHFNENPEKAMKTIADWGIEYLEGGDNTYGLTPEQFKSLAEKNGLIFASVGASFEELADHPEGILERAKFFGVEYVMCPWIPHQANNFSLEDAKRAIEVFNSAGAELEKNGIKLAYHPHGYEFRSYQSGTLFDYMAKNAHSFYFEMDTYWVQQGGEDPLSLLNEYPNKFILMHLKDMEKGTPIDQSGHADVETNTTLGTGALDMEGLLMKARELKMPYLFLEDESSRVLQQVPKSLQFIDKVWD